MLSASAGTTYPTGLKETRCLTASHQCMDKTVPDPSPWKQRSLTSGTGPVTPRTGPVTSRTLEITELIKYVFFQTLISPSIPVFDP